MSEDGLESFDEAHSEQRRAPRSPSEWLKGSRLYGQPQNLTEDSSGQPVYAPRSYVQFTPEGRNILLQKDEVIEYCPNADFYLFIRQIEKLIPMVLIAVVAVYVLGIMFGFLGPMMECLKQTFVMPFKPYLASGATTSAAVTVAIGWLSCFSSIIYGGAGLLGAWWALHSYFRPTHIALRWDCIATVKHQLLTTSYRPSNFVWTSDIQRVTVERPVFKRSSLDYLVCIQSVGRNPIRIRLGDIFVPEERSYFVNFLKSHTPFDEEDLELIKPPASNMSYTELWLLELSAPPKRDKLTPLEPGTVLNNGKYRVIAKIGVGGQGTVYYAHSSISNSVAAEVVLKEFVLPVFPDARVRRQSAEKFQEEANMLSRLDHPQIVDFLDLFLEDHRAYLVLEKVDGTTLKALVEAEGPQTEKYVAELMRSMCVVLAYLHGQSPPIVHRDFTPDNLILEPDGKVKLIDFSVAQKIENDITGSVVGKANYIAPEQFRGKPVPASDLYSLGATASYLLTARDPEPISRSRPRSIREDISEAMDDIVAGLTHLDPDKRYKNVEEVQADLDRLG
ncbi:MAG: serine/threonine protein kinase [Candidatus Obscuribacterales bacterium]